MAYFDHILHTNACQHYLTTGMRNSLIIDGRGFAVHNFSWLWIVSENAHNFEPHGKFGSNLANLFILTLSSHWYAKW